MKRKTSVMAIILAASLCLTNVSPMIALADEQTAVSESEEAAEQEKDSDPGDSDETLLDDAKEEESDKEISQGEGEEDNGAGAGSEGSAYTDNESDNDNETKASDDTDAGSADAVTDDASDDRDLAEDGDGSDNDDAVDAGGAGDVTDQETSKDNGSEGNEAAQDDNAADSDMPGTDSDNSAGESTGNPAADTDNDVEGSNEIGSEKDNADDTVDEEMTSEKGSAASDGRIRVASMESEEQSVVPGDLSEMSPDELFAMYVEDAFDLQGDGSISNGRRSQASKLSGNDLKIYNKIAAILPSIAAGERSSTIFEITLEELGFKDVYTASELGVTTVLIPNDEGGYDFSQDANDAIDALFESADYDLERIISALIADYPYELYWYNKTVTTFCPPITLDYAYSGSTDEFKMSWSNIEIHLPVVFEYSIGDYQVDQSKGQSVQASVQNAAEIVTDNEGKKDVEKLTAYKDAICDLVSYNHDAANDDTTLYGNPWQLIWVFDGNSETNVVCEGYSKAFKYLCDQSTFAGDVDCILVTGSLGEGTGAGPHMWNVVSMPDGKNYLVDVTNCDSELLGATNRLFLVGYGERSPGEGRQTSYTIINDNHATHYEYDEDTLSLFDASETDLNNVHYSHVHTPEHVNAVSASCTEDGNTEYWYCDACKSYFSDEACENEITQAETVVPKGHTLNKTDAVAATCTDDGNIDYWYCSKCEKYFSDEACENEITQAETVVPAGHDAEKTAAEEATCTTAGNIEYWYCDKCGKYFSDEICENEIAQADTVISAAGHNEEKIAAVEATCTTNGNIEYWYCDKCGKYFSDEACESEITQAETVMPAGHTAERTAAVEATCTTAGNIEYWYCDKCGKYFSDEICENEITQADTVISATGHTNNPKHTEAKAATCTENGNIEYWTCDQCNRLFSDEACESEITQAETVINATGHTNNPKHYEAVEATCTTDGNSEYWYCDKCEQYFSDEACEHETTLAETVIKATGHADPLAHTEAVAATCTENGNSEYWYCSKCEKYFSDEACEHETTLEETVISATGHVDPLGYTEAKEATCTEDGNTEYWYCSKCEKYFSDEACEHEVAQADTVINATGHADPLEHTEAREATCTEDGNTEYWYCSKCKKYFSDEACKQETTLAQTVVPAGHNAVKTEAKAATCTADGNIEYWHCNKCNKYFGDASCEQEITLAKTVISATGHADSPAHTAAVAATCTAKGNIEYWYCDKCGKYFSDEACEHEITLAQTVVPARHDAVKTEAIPATCTAQGTIEYWYCDKCGKYFSDEACEHEITLAETVTQAVPHKWSGWTVTKAATYDAAGSKERECANCHAKQTQSVAKLPRTALNKSMISGVGNKIFTGSAIKQNPIVKNGSTVLTAGKDYTVDNGKYVNAGTAYVTVTGKGAYSGTVKIPYTIAPMSIKSAVVTGIANQTYTGKALKPVPVVKLGAKTLSAGTDYKVTYASNKKVGKATVTITGAGNYTGKVSKTFVINPKKTRIKKVTSLTQGFTVKWVKQSAQTTGYQIQYSTNKNFKSGKKTVTIAKAKTVSKKITGLKEKTTYYVRIRTYKKAGAKYCSAWSAVKKVTTK